MKAIELARMEQDGSWTLIGEFDTIEEAKTAAEANCDGAYHLDDDSVVFGLTTDPNGGHYETRVGVWDGEALVLN